MFTGWWPGTELPGLALSAQDQEVARHLPPLHAGTMLAKLFGLFMQGLKLLVMEAPQIRPIFIDCNFLFKGIMA